MPRKDMAGGKNAGATLKKFRKHSRSPGVRELLNERVKRIAKSERRRRRRSTNDARTYPRPLARSPMLDATKCKRSLDNLQQVRNQHFVTDDQKWDKKFQDILGIALCDPVGDGETQDQDFELNLSQSLSEICHVEDEPKRRQSIESSPDISCRLIGGQNVDLVNNDVSVKTPATSPRPQWISSLKRMAIDAKCVSQGLDPTDLLKIHPFLTTMSDHVNHLRNMLRNQETCHDISSDSDTDEELFPEEVIKTPSSVISKRSNDTFLMGHPATLEGANPFEKGRFETQNHRRTPTPPSWLIKDAASEHPEEFAMDSENAYHDRDEDSFGRHFEANVMNRRSPRKHFRCTSPDPFIGVPYVDSKYETRNSSFIACSTEIHNSKPSRCRLFDDIQTPSPGLDGHLLDNSSPGLEDYERLARRSLAFLEEDGRTSPKFFGVPRSFI